MALLMLRARPPMPASVPCAPSPCRCRATGTRRAAGGAAAAVPDGWCKYGVRLRTPELVLYTPRRARCAAQSGPRLAAAGTDTHSTHADHAWVASLNVPHGWGPENSTGENQLLCPHMPARVFADGQRTYHVRRQTVAQQLPGTSGLVQPPEFASWPAAAPSLPDPDVFDTDAGQPYGPAHGADRRSAFALAAHAFAQQTRERLPVSSSADVPQRSDEWLRLRDDRLTASSFSTACGMWGEERLQALWREKLGLQAPDPPNAAMKWGSVQEAHALAAYTAQTQRQVTPRAFAVWRDDHVHSWLGASPDGLLEHLPSAQDQGGAHGGGVVEIKCPYNRGRPDLARPPASAPHYYMPQVQGQLEILDRQWCHLYVWTPQGGSALFVVVRDRAYWALLCEVLSKFWFSSVQPAAQLLARGAPASDVLEYCPQLDSLHPSLPLLFEHTHRMAAQATLVPA